MTASPHENIKMKSPSKYGFVVFVIAIGVGWVFFHPADSGTESVNVNSTNKVEGLEDVSTSVDDPSKITAPTNLDPKDLIAVSKAPQEVLRIFSDAKTASEAYDAIEYAYNSGNENLGLWAEGRLALYCHGRSELLSPPYESTKWAWEKLIEYCGDYDPLMIKRFLDNINEGIPYPAKYERENLRASLDSLSQEEQVDLLIEYITEAEAPYELTAAFELLRQMANSRSAPPLNFGQDPNISLRDYMAVQEAAGLLIECEAFGGCGQGEAQMLAICYQLNTCDELWTVDDYLMNNLSPYQHEQLQKMLSFIYSDRGG